MSRVPTNIFSITIDDVRGGGDAQYRTEKVVQEIGGEKGRAKAALLIGSDMS